MKNFLLVLPLYTREREPYAADMNSHTNNSIIRLAASLLCAATFLPFVAVADDLPTGTAMGTFTPEGKPAVTLAFAGAFVDVKDERSPVILFLSDKKLPTEKWTSEFDLMRENPKFNGVAFWIDKEGSVFRSATYVDGRHSSVSGYFELKLDGAMEKNLTGAVKTNDPAGDGPKADATFHVTLK